jgi:hypothetical protein
MDQSSDFWLRGMVLNRVGAGGMELAGRKRRIVL